MGRLNTENQVFPICPWCGSELDPVEFELDIGEAASEDYHLSIEVLCSECNEPIEITASLVYSTYKSDKDIDELIDDERYDEEDIDYEYEE